eukprot:Nitzschia sp. Nitz4//scaffold14_size191712//187657//190353//NITZ4_001757-RA/size191712-snap-gene-0.169-mRNA-1//-1//CDS//3329537029//1518//frame0
MLHTVSNNLNTWLGSRSDDHSVKPTTSRKQTVHSGYKSAMAMQSASRSEGLSTSGTVDVKKPEAFRRSRTSLGKREFTTAPDFTAESITVRCRTCTNLSYNKNIKHVSANVAAKLKEKRRGADVMNRPANSSVGYALMWYKHFPSGISLTSSGVPLKDPYSVSTPM